MEDWREDWREGGREGGRGSEGGGKRKGGDVCVECEPITTLAFSWILRRRKYHRLSPELEAS